MAVVSDKFFQKRKIEKRKQNTKNVIPYILIVCEGEKTEPNYFRGFKIRTKDVAELEISGDGKNTDTLVEDALRIKKKYEKERGIKFEQVWCVFDRDSFPAERFNNAFFLSKKYKFQVAYSNQAFELWYLLHFNYYCSDMHRDVLKSKLDEIMRDKYSIPYEKNSKKMYDLLMDKQGNAINNAIRLLDVHKTNPTFSPEKDAPSTTVHELVIELNKYIKKG